MGAPSLVTQKHWTDFETEQGFTIGDGVNKNQASLFFEFLRRSSIPLNNGLLFPNRLSASVSSVIRFAEVASSFADGRYLVGSAEFSDVMHRSVLLARRSEQLVIDRFDDDESPPCVYESLTNLM